VRWAEPANSCIRSVPEWLRRVPSENSGLVIEEMGINTPSIPSILIHSVPLSDGLPKFGSTTAAERPPTIGPQLLMGVSPAATTYELSDIVRNRGTGLLEK